MKIKYLSGLLIFIFILFTCFQVTAKGTDMLQERIYLQTDKQVYLSGELVWLKLITTDTDGKPSFLSKIAYVELLDGSESRVQIKLDINNGVGEGWIALPAILPTGYYRVVAYTRYMKNEGTGVFFNKDIAVINTFNNEEKPENSKSVTTSLSAPQLQKMNNTISLATDNAVYSRRGAAKIILDNLPDNIHTLSVSVAGKDLLPIADGKSLTEWRSSIKSVGNKIFENKYLPEYEGHIISGKLVNIETGQTEHERYVVPFMSYIGDKIHFFSGHIDDKGIVSFYTRHTNGVKEIATTLQNVSGKRYRIDIESPFSTQHDDKPKRQSLPLDSAYKEQLLDRSVGLQVLYAYMNNYLNQFEYEYPYFSSRPQNSYSLDEYTRFVTMHEVITEFVNQVRISRTQGKSYISLYREDMGFSTGNTLVLIDGVPILDHGVALKYNPLLVKQLDIYYDKYVFGGQIFDGILSFYTYNLNYPDLEMDESCQFFDYEGTQICRQFYMPDYDNESKQESRLPDFRHTLYWAPHIPTNGSRSLSVPFYTSDLQGEYTVKVEGLTTDGKVVEAMSVFKVE